MTNATPQKIALVTGGSRGLGRSSVLQLAQRGVDAIFTYKSNEAEAKAVVQQVRALGRQAEALPLDVGDSRQFAAFADRVKATLASTWQRDRFDYLVNNAGMGGAHALVADALEHGLADTVRRYLRAIVAAPSAESAA